MKTQYRCKHARIDFDPDYREYCAIGLQDCTGCQMADIVTVEYTPECDNEYQTYNYGTGTMETWRTC